MGTFDLRTDYTPTMPFRQNASRALAPDPARAAQTAPSPPADLRGDIPRADWEDFKKLLRKVLQPFPDAWEAFLAAIRADAMPHRYGPQVT